jgi:hypothetical protein
MNKMVSRFRLVTAALFFCQSLIGSTSFAWMNVPSRMGDFSRKGLISFSRNALHLSNRSQQAQPKQEDYLQSLLITQGYDRRLITLSISEDLFHLAEIHEKGQAHVCQIISFELDPSKDPRLQVKMGDGTARIVDLGQLTTIWEDLGSGGGGDWQHGDQSKILETLDRFPVGHIDLALDSMYQSRVGRARSSEMGLTKKQVSKLAAAAPSNGDDTERVLRQVVKTGTNFARLVDSSTAVEFLFDEEKVKKSEPRLQRAVGAYALANDAGMGGRFKRMPCILVSANTEYITLVNGGWVILDKSVRAGTEARKFAERESLPQTAADERIALRLECLAMGQSISSDVADQDLELDVRETLKAMGLPRTPAGAKAALVQIGRWSTSTSQSNKPKIEPWSQSILQAAGWYKEMDQNRRLELYNAVQIKDREAMEGRVDLTKFPCVCIDAAKTTFRDDSIGVRTRSSTGRQVVEDASKWEILIHIVDVSDIYAPENDVSDPSNYLGILREAAVSRGASRYDLPMGPLHLMPPLVIQALSLDIFFNPILSQKMPTDMNRPTTNRCVTLWAYIDERNGELLESGLERTIISCPLALSFDSATTLLEGSLDSRNDPGLAKARAVLGVAERNLRLWSENHQIQNTGAQSRENRLAVREVIAKQVMQGKNQRDDGRDGGFQRSRGHRLVDDSLNLYAYATARLMRMRNAPIPKAYGSPDMRLATGPLRRYVDGMAQRQALSVMCRHGGSPMTLAECMEAGQVATDAINSITNVSSFKPDTSGRKVTVRKGLPEQQRKAFMVLQAHMARNKDRPVPAISNGKQNEVVILGVGAIATCKGVEGTLKPGDRVMVRILSLNEYRGTISVVLVETQ